MGFVHTCHKDAHGPGSAKVRALTYLYVTCPPFANTSAWTSLAPRWQIRLQPSLSMTALSASIQALCWTRWDDSSLPLLRKVTLHNITTFTEYVESLAAAFSP
jgi:hypothetical protein